MRDWTKGQKAAERLSAHVLRVEGYSSVDPSHPLGGPDGLKDIVCSKDGIQWIGAAYFPRTHKSQGELTKKFADDLKGVNAYNVGGFAFITNQEISLGERNELRKLARASNAELDLFHLERVAQILDTPTCYGIRLEFLDIEQLAFIAAHDAVIERLQSHLERIIAQLESSGGLKNVPLDEINEFKRILDSVAGNDPWSGLLAGSILGRGGHIRDLHVPLKDLREFEQILNRIVGMEGSLSSLLYSGLVRRPVVQDLRVPLDELREYENTLDRVIEKLREVNAHKLKEIKGLLPGG